MKSHYDWLTGKLSQLDILPVTKSLFAPERRVSPMAIEGHVKAQRLSYEAVLTISEEVRPGWTEKRAADLIDTYLKDNGVKNFFHYSFAWFGERTRFDGIKSYWDFLPTDRILEEDEVIILDTAPIVEGYAGDIGYTFSLLPHKGLDKAKEDLQYLKDRITELFLTVGESKVILETVDRELKSLGYDNCYEKYPFSVLGHRLHHYKSIKFFPDIVRPFSAHSYLAMLGRGLFPDLLGPHHESNLEGIWAIEPHIGGDGFGAKFEQILVVNKSKVYWPDEEAII